jgi:hypothetical protein
MTAVAGNTGGAGTARVKPRYLANIHNFRTVAILGIVGAHSLHNFEFADTSLTFRIIDTICNESSVWFFFIAGLLFQHLSTNFQYSKYMKSKAQNVIAPYLILSIPALIASFTIVDQGMPPSFETFSMPVKVLIFLATGKHLAPFWFVPTITLIYLLGGLLIVADRKAWPYFLIPVFVVYSMFGGRDGLLIYTGLSGYFSPFSKALYLFSVYFAGMACGRYHDQLVALLKTYHWPLLVISAAMFYFAVTLDNDPVHFLYLFKLSSAILLVYYLSVFGVETLGRLAYVGTVSFGIFFVHGYLLQAVKIGKEFAFGDPLFPPSVLWYIGFAALITAASVALLYIAKAIFGRRSRMVVGA